MGLSFEASLIPGGAFFNGGNRALIDYVRGLGSRGVLQFSGPNLDSTTYTADDLAKLHAALPLETIPRVEVTDDMARTDRLIEVVRAALRGSAV